MESVFNFQSKNETKIADNVNFNFCLNVEH